MDEVVAARGNSVRRVNAALWGKSSPSQGNSAAIIISKIAEAGSQFEQRFSTVLSGEH